jgi:excisionase family DNA binding protein
MSTHRAHEAREESWETLIHQQALTVEEVAELFRFSPDLVRHAIWNGELRARMIGHEICDIARADLIAWLQARAKE